MARQGAARWHRVGGFTLVELMIVIVIATILLSIAIPSYMAQLRQSRRTEAKTALLDLAGREERFFSTNGSIYSTDAASLGYPAFPATVGSGYYQVIAPCTPACAPSPAIAQPSFTIKATPLGTQAQDTQCVSFSVDSSGRQFASDVNGNDTTTTCWPQ